MPRVARIGDPLDHGGTVIQGSPKLFADGLAVARVGDQVMCAIHALQTIVTGSPKLEADGKRVARVGSLCSCGAVIIDGSPKMETN
jgi:uncharacterized Zn-binding protein involved in type VI secretion